MPQVLIMSTNGDSIDITDYVDEDVFMVRGASGLFGAPPARIRSDYVAGLPGSVVRNVVHDARKGTLPLNAFAGGAQDMIDVIRRIALLADPVLNTVTLRYVGDDGHIADLGVEITAGLDIPSLGSKGPNLQEIGLEMFAPDPYWYGFDDVQVFEFSEPVDWFPFPPLVLGSSSVIGDIIYELDADVPSWPVWIASGPGSTLTLTNHTTGEVFAMDGTASLLLGETITIDTRPRGITAKTVKGPAGVNWFGKLTSRNLWALQPGTNEISIAFADADVGSFVALTAKSVRLTP